MQPFEDGNGRTARLLSSFLLMRAGLPPLNILSEHRDRYFAALQRAHPRRGGCTRQLVQVVHERVQHALELVDALLSEDGDAAAPSTTGAPSATTATAEVVAVEVDVEGGAARAVA